jgi:glutathione S-transferase
VDIYLHHYPASLFSEKIRLLLGYLGLSWKSVIIPSIMPRPLLMPLSGGYRRTPVLQIGANVYCDTRIIAKGLARHAGDDTLYAHGFNAHRVADWADTQLFAVTVALNFAPAAVASMLGSLPRAEAAAFREDRAKLTQGGSITTLSPEAAAAHFHHGLHELNGSIGQSFLFGERPCIADFSVYHCLWFVRNNPVNAPLLEEYPAARGWMERMAAFGHGHVEQSDGEAALGAAQSENPELPALTSRLPEGLSIGDTVTVTPADYGRIPVAGTLAAWAPDEIVIARDTPETGRVFVHFPSAGFEVARA